MSHIRCRTQISECNKVFSGAQPCENGVVIWRFGDRHCLLHQNRFSRGWSPDKNSSYSAAVETSNLKHIWGRSYRGCRGE